MKRRAGPLHQSIVRLAAAAQIKDARGEHAVAPARGETWVVLEDRRAELVVVRVRPFEKDEASRRRGQLPGRRAPFQPAEHLARSGQPIAAEVGKDFLYGRVTRLLRHEWLQAIERDLALQPSAAEEREKSRVLQQQ